MIKLLEFINSSRGAKLFSVIIGFAIGLMFLRVCTKNCKVVGAKAFKSASTVKGHLPNGQCVEYIPFLKETQNPRKFFVQF